MNIFETAIKYLGNSLPIGRSKKSEFNNLLKKLKVKFDS